MREKESSINLRLLQEASQGTQQATENSNIKKNKLVAPYNIKMTKLNNVTL